MEVKFAPIFKSIEGIWQYQQSLETMASAWKIDQAKSLEHPNNLMDIDNYNMICRKDSDRVLNEICRRTFTETIPVNLLCLKFELNRIKKEEQGMVRKLYQIIHDLIRTMVLVFQLTPSTSKSFTKVCQSETKAKLLEIKQNMFESLEELTLASVKEIDSLCSFF